MPSIGHLVYGIALMIPFLAFSNDKITKKAATIFVITNYIGPDSSYVYIFLPWNAHALIGYLFWAIIIAFCYSYFSRFTILKEGKSLKIIDEGKRDIRWRGSYLLCVAGGICHHFIDMIFHKGFTFHIWEDYRFSLQDMHDWEDAFGYYHSKSPIVLVSMGIILLLILAIWYVFTKDYKDVVMFFVCITIGLGLGLWVTKGVIYAEFEIGTTFFTLIWVFIPNVFVVWAIKDAQQHPPEEKESKFTAQQKILLVSLIIFIVAIGVIGIAVYLMNNPNVILNLVPSLEASLITIGAIILIIFSSMLIVLAILLFKKKNIARKSSILLLWLTWPLVIPTMLAFVLCETAVVAEFQKKPIEN
jgi:hypothetical protein